LLSLLRSHNPDKTNERLQLEADINTAKQCLDVCKLAGEASHEKIYRIGEVIADGNSDQVVVTTLADLFDIKKAHSKDKSAQLVGSMTDGNLQHLTEKRYDSRFGGLASSSDSAKINITGSSTAGKLHKDQQYFSPLNRDGEQATKLKTRQSRPSPNEVKKRMTDDDMEQGNRLTTER
jgi:hypothetical protein